MSNAVPLSNLKPLAKRKLGAHSFVAKFGATEPANLPLTLGRPFLPMPDQGATEFCTAFGEAVASGYKYGISMSPRYQVAMESFYFNFPILQGADAQGSMDATLAFDSLPLSLLPDTLTNLSVNDYADWTKIPYKTLWVPARPYFPGIPYKVDGPYDIFDNIRSALYQSWKIDKSVVKVFGYWYSSFNLAAAEPTNAGHVQTPTDSPITMHRYTIIDWITDASGVPYLVAALTQGNDFGDRGHLYMGRETVNTIFADLSNGLGLYIAKPSSFDLNTTIADFRVILGRLGLH